MKKTALKVLILIIPLIVLLLILFFALHRTYESSRASVILSNTNLVFSEVGETAELTVKIVKNGVELTEEEHGEKILWTSSNQSVAVAENGLVTVVGYGSCVIRASCADYSSYCTVNVPNPNPPLSISASELTIDNIGKKKTIHAISGSGENISSMATWKSSNENIAVCEDGQITAVGYGSCSITAVYNRKTAVCFVTVKNPAAPVITLSNDKLKLNVGESFALSAKTDHGAGDTITWKSSDESIVSCTDGVITANKTGKCAIIAITENGYTDVCIVTVGNPTDKNKNDNLLHFDFPDLENELLCIDKSIGQISSSATVIGYEMKTLLLDDGRLVIELSLKCIKTYDSEGIDGRTPAMITVSLYREGDTFCDKKIYKSEEIAVGDTFTIKYSGFTVQTKTDGTARELYMTFATITEK